MIELKPNCLYSRADLAQMLEPVGVDVDHFIARLKPRKVFKMLWTGEDLLAALRTAPPLAERPNTPELPAPGNRGNRKRRNGRASAEYPGARLDAYMQTLKKEGS